MSIDLFGIEKENLILYEKVMKDYFFKLGELSNNSNITCQVFISNLKVLSSKNCNVSILNDCKSNSSNSLNLLIRSIYENKNLMSDKLLKKIEKNLGVELTEANITNTENVIYRKCDVSAEVNNRIEIDELVIKNCIFDEPMNFFFYNTGSVQANCGITEFISSITKEPSVSQKEKESENLEIQSIFDLSLSNILTILLTVFIMLVVFIIIKMYVKQGKLRIYQATYKI